MLFERRSRHDRAILPELREFLGGASRRWLAAGMRLIYTEPLKTRRNTNSAVLRVIRSLSRFLSGETINSAVCYVKLAGGASNAWPRDVLCGSARLFTGYSRFSPPIVRVSPRLEFRLFAGPIFNREFITSPRQLKHYVIRAGYVAGMFVLMYTTSQATFGWKPAQTVGEVARFGGLLFQIFSLVQLVLVLFFARLFSAGNVAQEKDRQTLILLLMTELKDRELVLGKLFSSLLLVGVLLAASIPVFALTYAFGGVSLKQIGASLAICAATALASGSWGALVALWREKTFQTLAVSVLGTVLFIGAVEAGAIFAGRAAGYWIGLLNPFRAMMQVLDPLGPSGGAFPTANIVALLVLAAVLNGIAIFRLRLWNPSRTLYVPPSEADIDTATGKGKVRDVWANPVIWREMRTKAYGRKVFAINAAYFAIFAAAMAFVFRQPVSDGTLVLGMISPSGFAFVALGLIGLLLINAQAVTSLTTERDLKTLELLLVTNITAKEFIYGKLGGIFYNTKEIILPPLIMAVYFAATGVLTVENMIYLVVGYLCLAAFSAMLGLHAGITYDSSRTAIANSLGTMFFLFLGIFICLMLIIESRSSFLLQLPSFLVFILGGSLGLWGSLTHKNPSPALTISALVLPFLTFYAITGFLLDNTLGVLVAVAVTYGFTTLAMLVPAVSEFDVALGRSTMD